MNFVERIEELFTERGSQVHQGQRHEPVSALQHALQCAQLAEWAHAELPLVAAALLHDVGHFIEAAPTWHTLDDVHEMRAVPLLAPDGSLQNWVGMNTDITDRRHAEDHRSHADRRRRTGFAHC